jgi:L-Ala-D/L-Glu epimerase
MPKSRSLKLSFVPYTLNLKHKFSVAWGSRETTPVVLTRIEYDGIKGYGEASMPPYLGESVESVTRFLTKVDLTRFGDIIEIEAIINYVDSLAPGNFAAKASVDIALHDLVGKLQDKPWYKIWGLNPDNTPYTSFTIGIDEPAVIKKKVSETGDYRILKVKLGSDNDRAMISAIREMTSKELYVDVNQGWKDKHYALDMIHWLKEQGVTLIEQPMPDSMEKELKWLIDKSPLPVFADEGIKTIEDIERRKGLYDGVNIKLMKCGGMRNAYRILNIARESGMKVMIGCMTETSCAVSAASQLSPAVDYADLDGNLLISNDCYSGVMVVGGKITLSEKPGIGIKGNSIIF